MNTRVMSALMGMVLILAGAAEADWCETNNDNDPCGGLDHIAYWVAAWNGSGENPNTDWYTASYLSTWYGTDSGWVSNVVNITDEDATAYAAANKVESFYNVRAYVSLSTADLDEEFGVIVRASDFDFEDPITDVSGYAATFSVNNATGPGDPMLFSLYKIVNGVIVDSETANPEVPVGFDDLITLIELTAYGGDITARLFDDSDDTVPLQTLNMTDSAPLGAGYTGVINLDYISTDGISSFYDTLWSLTINDPAGDLDDDDDVDLADMAILFSNWQDTGCSVPNDWCQRADIIINGTVDIVDLAEFSANWLVGT